MEFFHETMLNGRKKGDLLVLPFWKEKKAAASAADLGEFENFTKIPITSGDFKGKEGEVTLLYASDVPETRVALVGLGEKKEVSVEVLRRAYAAVAKAANSKKVQHVNVLIPSISSLDEEALCRGIAEGLLLVNYAFEKHKLDSLKHDQASLIKKGTLIGATKKGSGVANDCALVAEGVYFARDLVNTNADEINPQTLAKCAKQIAKDFKGVKATIFDKKRIEKEKMGLLLAVNRGSSIDPAFIILEYKGDPKSKDHTVVVGKGITYDTGGLNLKPTGFMETMKADMGGSATALGTIFAAANVGLKRNVTAVIPSTENSIGSHSYKPGDVYTSYAGKTVEIGNTDAEGRLVLADALAYTCKNLKPTRIVDFATLTGAIVVALGEETTGLMSNNDKLAQELANAGESTHERVWRMPLFKEYKKLLKSDFADINNCGGREAGSITAALFLEEFVDKNIPWAHCDIAGTAFLSKELRYNPKHATGVGVRLMIDFLSN